MKSFSFQWHITDECDQRCKHCYIYADKELNPYSPQFDVMEKILENCIDFCRKTHRKPYFFLTGGDPILHPDFWKLADKLKGLQIPFTILGNPFHLDPDTCKRLKESGCERYQLSLDGLEKTHDWFRKPGSFQKTLEVLPYLKEAGIRTAIMSTVSNINLDEIRPLMELVVQHPVDVYAFGRYCPSDPSEEKIPPERYHQFLSECDQKVKELETQYRKKFFAKKDHLFTLLDYENGEFRIPDSADPEMIYGGCHCGNSHLTILPNGEIYACRRLKESRVGNALTDSIFDLWFNQMEDYRDYEKFEKCTDCTLRAWCRGCPAVAKGYNGSFYSPDPQCWK